MTLRFRRLWLLAGLAGALASSAAAADDPLGKDPAGRLSSPLYRMARLVERGEPLSSETLRTARAGLRYLDPATGTVTAIAILEEGADPDRFVRLVTANGGRVSGIAENLVRVHLPPKALQRLSRDGDVRFLKLPDRPRPLELTSEGIHMIRAPEFIARTGADGAGVRVGILDGTSFESARSLVGSELPDNTIFTDSVGDGEGRHGTACAELVHDVAPGAQLVLASVSDEVGFLKAVNLLLDQDVRIISASIAWPNSTAPDGSGYYAYYVNRFAARALWVNAAGNSSNSYVRGPAADADGDGQLEIKDREMVPLHVYRGEGAVSLSWNEASGYAAEDYDLLVVTDAFRNDPRPTADNPAVIGTSTDKQDGRGYPFEYVEFTSDNDRDLYAVVVSRGPKPTQYRKFSIWVDGYVLEGLADAAGSIEPPADASGAVAVAAIEVGTDTLRGYSSRGPTDDGRVKPDVAGPDGVSSRSYRLFTGTSAATPHVAGAAALLLSRNPSLTLTQLRDALELATASHRTNKNNDVGYGLVNLDLVP